MKKKIARIVGFVLILSIVIFKLNDVVAFKYTDGVTQMEHFYDLDEETVDVLVLGSSHAFVDVNPAMLYEEYGIASYDLCGSMQPMWNTYYWLKEAYEYQQPKLIVLDVYRLVEEFPYSKESKLVKNTYGMRFSRNKYEAIKVSLEEEDRGDLLMHLLEFPSYHSRYVDLTAADFGRRTLVDESYKGEHLLTEVEQVDRPELSGITETAQIEPKTMEYFEKILLFAKEKDVPVLLINAPYIVQENDKKIYNTFEAYLATQTLYDKVAYVDFNKMYDEMGIDFETDFADHNHLNVNGLPKFNRVLGAYIEANYDLPDRRKDAAFASYITE